MAHPGFLAVLVDTSVLIDAERRGATLDDAVGGTKRAISVITISEYLHGAHRIADEGERLRREALVERVLAPIEAIPITDAVARVHARISAALRRAGTPISPHDLWIAATALSHGMKVATANVRDFERVPGLVVVPV
jgi:tRNA(fMet)-specific endonuclease VapC